MILRRRESSVEPSANVDKVHAPKVIEEQDKKPVKSRARAKKAEITPAGEKKDI